ncbi:MAG: hemerythrin domain-containing protein [Gammaproteobacteria bacterium]|nr:hemerythrin domain-containing protein [Gammaproteobacteria bacterium]
MTLKTELKSENQKIADTIAVLSHLINHNELRSNPVFCDLLKQFSDSVNDHLKHEGRSVYSELLPHKENGDYEVATKFINNTNMLTKILGDYAKHWCKAPRNFNNDEAFIDETKEIFHLVTERITLEQDKLFPLLKN